MDPLLQALHGGFFAPKVLGAAVAGCRDGQRQQQQEGERDLQAIQPEQRLAHRPTAALPGMEAPPAHGARPDHRDPLDLPVRRFSIDAAAVRMDAMMRLCSATVM